MQTYFGPKARIGLACVYYVSFLSPVSTNFEGDGRMEYGVRSRNVMILI